MWRTQPKQTSWPKLAKPSPIQGLLPQADDMTKRQLWDRTEASHKINSALFFSSVKYKPTKEHLSKQIPEAVQSINALLESLKQEIGADDRYVSLLLDAMAEERVRLHNKAENNFGFR